MLHQNKPNTLIHGVFVMRTVSIFAGLVMLLGTLCCTSCSSKDSVQTPDNFDLTGSWQLRFEPPLIYKDSGGGLPKGAPIPEPHELGVRVTIQKIQSGSLLGYIDWIEGDMSFKVGLYPTFAKGQLRGFLPSDLELIGSPEGKDTIKGKVSLQNGKSAPTNGIFKETYRRQFKLSRIVKKAK